MNQSIGILFPGVDKPIFYSSLISLMMFAIPLFIWPEWSSSQLAMVKNQIHDNADYLYQWMAIVITIFAIWIAFSKAGQ